MTYFGGKIVSVKSGIVHSPYDLSIQSCSKCKSENVVFAEVNGVCDCAAPLHFDKFCLDCGYRTLLHRRFDLEED